MQQVTQFRGLDDKAVMLLNAPPFNTAAINESSMFPAFSSADGGDPAEPGWSGAPRRLHRPMGVTHALVFPRCSVQ